LIPTLVIGSLLAGKPVIAIRDGADPEGNGGKVFGAVPGSAPALRAKLTGHLDTLASYGVELVSEEAFLAAVEQRLGAQARVASVELFNGRGSESRPVPHQSVINSKFVTETDLLTLQPGTILRLPAGSRLTPLAWETANRCNIQIVCE